MLWLDMPQKEKKKTVFAVAGAAERRRGGSACLICSTHFICWEGAYKGAET